MARTGFWRGGDGVTSVLAWREGRKQDFGVPGMSRDAPGNVSKKGGKFKFNIVQCNGDGKNRILAWRGWHDKCFGGVGRVKTEFWYGGDCLLYTSPSPRDLP